MANVAKIEICFQQHLCSKARHQASDGEYLSGYNMIANPLPHLLPVTSSSSMRRHRTS
jgi:hypothetical protein